MELAAVFRKSTLLPKSEGFLLTTLTPLNPKGENQSSIKSSAPGNNLPIIAYEFDGTEGTNNVCKEDEHNDSYLQFISGRLLP